MNIYPRNTNILFEVSVIPQTDTPITTYEWSVNNTIVQEKTETLMRNTNDLLDGENIISRRVKNSCGSWSEPLSIIIKVEAINMEQEFDVIVDKPVNNVEVVMQLTGTVVVTVKDPLGVIIPNATVTIDTVSAPTDASGVATLNGIIYSPTAKKGKVVI